MARDLGLPDVRFHHYKVLSSAIRNSSQSDLQQGKLLVVEHARQRVCFAWKQERMDFSRSCEWYAMYENFPTVSVVVHTISGEALSREYKF